MAEPGWPGHALRIGRFEFQRTVRSLWRDKARFGLMALGLVFPSLLIAGFTLLFADAVRGTGSVPLPAQARGTVAMLWFFGVFIVGQRVASARPRVDAEALVLTTVSTRTAATGLLVAETLRAFAYLALPTVTLAAAALYLFGSVVSLVALPLSGLLLAATVVAVGSVLGYAVAWLVATSPFVARHRTPLGVVVVLLFFGVYALLQFPATGFAGQELLGRLPVGWFADLAAVGTPVRGSAGRALGAVAGSALVVVAAGALVERLTAAFWFVDPVRPDDGATAPDAAPAADRDRRDHLSAAVGPLAVPSAVDAPTRRVAEWALLRTRRDPRRLTFLLFPVVFLGSALVNVSASGGSLAAVAAPACAVVLPWLAGALFSMNPLGDEGAVLPVTLTAVSGRHYVRGLVLPGLLVGLPAVVVATGVAGLVAPYPLPRRLGLVALGGYLTVVAAAVTPAVGMHLPRFSAVRIGQSRAVLPPRLTAVALHAGVTLLPGSILALLVVAPATARTVVAGLLGYLPALLFGLLGGGGGPADRAATAFGAVGRSVQATPTGEFAPVAGGVLLLGGVVAAVGLYRHAIGYFEGYRPP